MVSADSGPNERISMRFAPFAAIATALALLTVGFAADAKPRKEQREWVRLRVRVNKPQSYLYAGTAVKPGTMRYTNYIGLEEFRFPSYGPPNDNRYYRWPLPGPYDLSMGY
jgi:hypothetical protein